MRTRLVAAYEAVFLLPALLFMAALAVRNLGAFGYKPATIAHQIVRWYADRSWTLWLLLLALPLIAFVTGCVTLLRTGSYEPGLWRNAQQLFTQERRRPWELLVAVTTLTAALILLIVIHHMLRN